MRKNRNSPSEFASPHCHSELGSSSPYLFSMEVVYLQIFFSNFTMSSWRFCHDIDAQNNVIHPKYYKGGIQQLRGQNFAIFLTPPPA